MVTNEQVCREHGRLEVAVDRLPPSEPGQFYQVRCSDGVELPPRVVERVEGRLPALSAYACGIEAGALLRRPLSIADQWRDDAGRDHLALIYRVVGAGTRWLRGVAPAALLDLTGPLGRGFELPAEDVPVACVGGGVGIPPLLYAARRLGESGRTKTTLILGATTRELLPLALASEPDPDGGARTCVELPAGALLPAIITSDDGSVGMRGMVTDALARWIEAIPKEGRARAMVLACGPAAMLHAVAGLTRAAGVACQVSIERNMGCGLGTCLSCIVRVRDGAQAGRSRWALTCREGPVFDRDVLCEL